MADETQHTSDAPPVPAAPEKILARGVFENCIHDQTEAPWEEEVRMILAHDAALRTALAAAERARYEAVEEAAARYKENVALYTRLADAERQRDEAVGAWRDIAKETCVLVVMGAHACRNTDRPCASCAARAVLARIAGEVPK